MAIDRRMVLGGLAASVVSLSRASAAPAGAVVRLEARGGMLALVPQAQTPVWGYGGAAGRPVLRLRKGEPLNVELVNRLDQPTTIHWHGVRGPNAMDGVGGLTQKPIEPGQSFAYRFTPPDSGLFWFHPRVFPDGPEQIGRGLYGVLIVEEAAPPPVDLDLLVVLDDWTLDPQGRIAGGFRDPAVAAGDGRMGPLLTVNGKPIAERHTLRPNARIRLRLLNACSARIAVVEFAGLAPTVVAIDGQPSELFRPAHDSVPIAPGSRFELMLDGPGEVKTSGLVSLRGANDVLTTLVSFAAAGAAGAKPPPVVKLPDNPLLPARIHLERAMRKEIVIAGGAAGPGSTAPPTTKEQAGLVPIWTLNGSASDGVSGPPLFKVKRGSPVVLTVVNRTAFAQQIDLHGHVFRLLHDKDDGWDPFWRDSLLIVQGRTKHLAFVADNPGRWSIASSILSRQVTGLAGWFEVV